MLNPEKETMLLLIRLKMRILDPEGLRMRSSGRSGMRAARPHICWLQGFRSRSWGPLNPQHDFVNRDDHVEYLGRGPQA